MVWLLRIVWDGLIVRRSTEPGTWNDEPWDGGLDDAQVTSALAKAGASADPVVSLSITWPGVAARVAQGRNLATATGELAVIPAGSTYASRIVVASGSLSQPTFGADADPVAFTIRPDTDDNGTLVPDPEHRVTLDSFASAPKVGAVYPEVIGCPGFISTGTIVPATPAIHIGSSQTLVAGHHCGGSGRVTLFGENTSGVQISAERDLIETVDFWPGGFGPQYGLATGGAIDVKLRPLKTDRWHGTIETNLIHSSVLVEGPVGEKTAIALAGRRSYIDVLLPLVIPEDVLGLTLAPRYYDYQLRLTHEFSPTNRFSFFWYGADDALDFIIEEPAGPSGLFSGRTGFSFKFHLPTARWNWNILPELMLDVSARTGFINFEAHAGQFFKFDRIDAFQSLTNCSLGNFDGTQKFGRRVTKYPNGSVIRSTKWDKRTRHILDISSVIPP